MQTSLVLSMLHILWELSVVFPLRPMPINGWADAGQSCWVPLSCSLGLSSKGFQYTVCLETSLGIHELNRVVAMYICARLILGYGIVFCIISGSAMIGELAYPKERAIMTSLFNSSYFIGAIIAAAIALRTATLPGNNSWRIPSFLQCFPSLIQIVFVL